MGNSSVMEPGVQDVLRISDLYRKKLGQAANFRRMAVEEDRTEFIRSHFKDRAFKLESQATELAHCLALFGDSPIASMDFEKHLAEVKQMTCEECNPWARGLATIKEQIAGGFTGNAIIEPSKRNVKESEMTKILTSGERTQDLRDTCVFLFGAMEYLAMPDILQKGLPIDLSGLRYPLSRMADAVLASGTIAESEIGEWDRFGRWHRVTNYITGVIEAVSVEIAESLGFPGKIIGGTWLHASIMEILFQQKASIELQGDDAFVKSWKSPGGDLYDVPAAPQGAPSRPRAPGLGM